MAQAGGQPLHDAILEMADRREADFIVVGPRYELRMISSRVICSLVCMHVCVLA